MIHRLDPAIPLVWRDTSTLQLGVDRVVCVFHEPTPSTQRMLAALATGAPRSALEVEAASAREVDELLAAVGEALVPRSAPSEAVVAIDGDGAAAERLHRLLREAGHRVVTADAVAWVDATANVDPAAVVIFGSYVIPPWRHGPWLRRDVPHLPVVFGDDGVELGPFVDSDGPCLRCVSLTRTDADPAWPAISAQLAVHPPAAEPALLTAQAVAQAARWVHDRVRLGDRSHAATSIRIQPDGVVTTRTHSRHVLCGCRVLPENVTALVARQRSRTSSAPVGASHA